MSIDNIRVNPNGRSPSPPSPPTGFDWGNLEVDSNGHSLLGHSPSPPPPPTGFDWGNLEADSDGHSLLLGSDLHLGATPLFLSLPPWLQHLVITGRFAPIVPLLLAWGLGDLVD
uniref:Uncharacterized protein n=1 Tax=Nelumbo nucifera TaxID=4432 RepID=A0A822Y129_NELNU|nr:TPA_asm: hypothetical protein HUJ06_027788 [Nelumbo nucifera]